VSDAGPVLFLIPARGGSVRIPGKNLRLVGGVSLLGRAVQRARDAARDLPGGPHRVVCSTDDPSIADEARAWGAEVLDRPASLATSEAITPDVARHALDAIEARDGIVFETLVVLQATSPLVEPSDVIAAIARSRAAEVSVTSVVVTHPLLWHKSMDGAGVLADVPSAPGRIVQLAGAFYVVAAADLRRTGMLVESGTTIGWELPVERGIDVDVELDLLAAEAVLAARRSAPATPRRLAILGSGQHARVVAEAALATPGVWELVGTTDPGREPAAAPLDVSPRLGDDEGYAATLAGLASADRPELVLGFGASPAARRRSVAAFDGLATWATVIHPRAWISPTATIGEGTVVMAGAVVNAGAAIGPQAIVNSRVVVEHDVRIGAFAQLAPGVTIGGGASIGEGTVVGLGAMVRDHIAIGDGVTVAMGAVVVDDVADGQSVFGVPARPR
jgi:sugar O-acyltransferase (sialic acid O-acetyltransferase NeuD family)